MLLFMEFQYYTSPFSVMCGLHAFLPSPLQGSSLGTADYLTPHLGGLSATEKSQTTP